MATEKKAKRRKPALYCGDFPTKLKERCESIAGALRISISQFVEEILEDETRELKGSYETIMQWHAARLKARAEAAKAEGKAQRKSSARGARKA